jgi:glycosyltransferase involved in cell wall biosynthesis
MPYAVFDIDLTDLPDAPLRVGKRSGAWVFVRVRGTPLGWIKLPPALRSRRLDPQELMREATRHHAVRIMDLLCAHAEAPDASRLPSISVIVCTRDHPDVLRRQLDSLMRLRYAAAHEVIVVDNAPRSPETRVACEAYPSVRYVLEPTPGLDFARNAGLHAARHDVVAYTDDDAAVDPGWLSAIGANYVDPGVHCVTGLTLPMELRTRAQHWFEVYGGMQRGFERRTFRPLARWTPFHPLGSGAFGAGVNMTMRRDAMLALGGFDPALDTGSLTRGGGDLDAMARIIRAGGTLVYEPRAVVWHQHRKTMRELRNQMWDYGHGFYAYLGKYARHDLELSNHAIKLMVLWYRFYARRLWDSVKLKLRRRKHLPIHLQLCEMAGALAGWRSYERSTRRAHELDGKAWHAGEGLRTAARPHASAGTHRAKRRAA